MDQTHVSHIQIYFTDRLHIKYVIECLIWVEKDIHKCMDYRMIQCARSFSH